MLNRCGVVHGTWGPGGNGGGGQWGAGGSEGWGFRGLDTNWSVYVDQDTEHTVWSLVQQRVSSVDWSFFFQSWLLCRPTGILYTFNNEE